MGKHWSTLGSKKRPQQLEDWKDSTWNFSVDQVELNKQLISKKRKAEIQLDKEVTKRRKLESEVAVLKETNKQQAKVIMKSKRSYTNTKEWSKCSRQQKYNRKKEIAGDIKSASRFYELKGFKINSVELQNNDTGKCEILDVKDGSFSEKENTNSNNLNAVLYVKDKYTISNEALHELSMVAHGLPKSSKVKKLAHSINSEFEIYPIPNGIVGVQQSLKTRVTICLTSLSEITDLPSTIKIKLTGDGTRIARGFNVVNFAFTILEKGGRASSVLGNHSVAILKVSESYDELFNGLQDICQEAQDLEEVTIKGSIYKVQFYLGGDWKFLATVCGLESATADHACIWCKCPKKQRFDMQLKWSINDPAHGARSIEEIREKARLPKRSTLRYNCCRDPIFSFIPISRVVIDSLHLFLRISDVLINLLIRDIQILDGLERHTSELPDKQKANMTAYVEFLNGPCKVKFNWYIDKKVNKLTYRDLTGPEKHRLFSKINIPTLFPTLNSKLKLQEVWTNFYKLIIQLGEEEFSDVDSFETSIKSWVNKFLKIYQTKDITPYIHAFSKHVPQFLRLYGNIVQFTQQGLEKLNDLTTKYFHSSSNHREIESLKQILQKQNRLEALEGRASQRTKKVQKCSNCKLIGHNKRSCKAEKV